MENIYPKLWLIEDIIIKNGFKLPFIWKIRNNEKNENLWMKKNTIKWFNYLLFIKAENELIIQRICKKKKYNSGQKKPFN